MVYLSCFQAFHRRQRVDHRWERDIRLEISFSFFEFRRSFFDLLLSWRLCCHLLLLSMSSGRSLNLHFLLLLDQLELIITHLNVIDSFTSLKLQLPTLSRRGYSALLLLLIHLEYPFDLLHLCLVPVNIAQELDKASKVCDNPKNLLQYHDYQEHQNA